MWQVLRKRLTIKAAMFLVGPLKRKSGAIVRCVPCSGVLARLMNFLSSCLSNRLKTALKQFDKFLKPMYSVEVSQKAKSSLTVCGRF